MKTLEDITNAIKLYVRVSDSEERDLYFQIVDDIRKLRENTKEEAENKKL